MKTIKEIITEILTVHVDFPPAIKGYLKRLNSLFYIITILYVVSLLGMGFSPAVLGGTAGMIILLAVKYFYERLILTKNCVPYKGKVKRFDTKWYVSGFMEKYVKRNLVMIIETDDKQIVKCALGKYQKASFIIDSEVIIFSAYDHKDENGSIIIDGYYAISTDKEDFDFIRHTLSGF